MKILFICLGNICRSPLAAGIMTHMLKIHGITGIAHSAGTSDWNVGSQADRRSIKVASNRGIDIRMHRARQLRSDDFDKYDLIIVMDSSNERAVKKLAPPAVHHKIRRVLGPDRDVPDPYYSDDSAFKSVFDSLWESCEELAGQIARQETV